MKMYIPARPAVYTASAAQENSTSPTAPLGRRITFSRHSAKSARSTPFPTKKNRLAAVSPLQTARQKPSGNDAQNSGDFAANLPPKASAPTWNWFRDSASANTR